MVAVAITRTELTAADLRGAAARAKDADAVRRMLALALVLEGHSRAEAAEACGMDRQTLRDWVHRYNAEGIAGLSDRRPPGRKPHLTPEQQAEVARWAPEQQAEVARWVEQGQGPDMERDGVVRWRRVDLQARIERSFAARLHPATVGKLLRKLAFRRLSVRPQHPQSDPAAERSRGRAIPRRRRRSGGLRRKRSGRPPRGRPGQADRGLVRRWMRPELVSRAR
jgi:transposase